MTQTFDRAMEFVLKWEGGDSHDARGGITRYGISARAYPAVDIGALTVDDARSIYLADYWLRMCCDELPPAIALVVFDASVNQGRDYAARCLQSAAGVPQDGIVGELTLRAAKACDPDDAAYWMTVQRCVRYSATAGSRMYLRGWIARAIACYAMAAQSQRNITWLG